MSTRAPTSACSGCSTAAARLGYGVTNLPGAGTGIVDLASAVLAGTSGLATSTTTTATTTAGTAASSLSSAIPTGATFALGTYNSNTGKGFAAIIQALRSDGTSNIISTPRVITMNNEEAEVKVTQEIPLITGSYTSSTASVSGTTSPFETIQREEVGTILKVTPHISEGDVIQMKIEQEDSSPGAKLTDSADISTNKRSIKTTILIEDGGTIVLGGLMQDTVTESEDRVPGLGAIPLIGNLFKSRSGSRQKKNLLVFLRPKICATRLPPKRPVRSATTKFVTRKASLHKGKITLLPGEKQPSIPPYSAAPPPRNSGPSTLAPAPQPARARSPRLRAWLRRRAARAASYQAAPPSSQPVTGTQPVTPTQPAPAPQPAPQP
jgi:general secretion pathway protein D